MRELQRKQKLKKALYSIPSLILLAILTFLLAKGAYGVMRIERNSADTVKNLEEETLALSLREEGLKREIGILNTEEGIIEEIREKFSVTREGERVAVIVEPKQGLDEAENEEAWWQKLWHAIMPSNDQ